MKQVEVDTTVVQWTVRRFLASLSHCRFAPHYVPTMAVFAGSPEPDDAATFDDVIVGAAEMETVAVLVFPEVQNGEGIVGLLQVLAGNARWRITLPPRGKHPHDDTLVGVWWTTPDGSTTSVMGLAPIGEMAVTRRAPYVSLVVWGGLHLNQHEPPRRSRPNEVGLTSLRPPEPYQLYAPYKDAWDDTRKNVRAATAFPMDRSGRPDIAFSLGSHLRDAIASFAVPCDDRGLPTR